MRCNVKVYDGRTCLNYALEKGMCLIHLKVHYPEIAEKYQKELMKEDFGLKDFHIDIIKKINGSLNYMNSGYAKFVKNLLNNKKILSILTKENE